MTRIAAIAKVRACSRVWETAPVGGPPQPDFFNAAILVDWQGTPHALLDALLAIETELGRVRSVPNGPRTIDLDVLWIEGEVVADPPRLVVPHPRLHERAFALAPLLEIAPGARDPRTGAPFVLGDAEGIRVALTPSAGSVIAARDEQAAWWVADARSAPHRL